jgi:hypothetical protein
MGKLAAAQSKYHEKNYQFIKTKLNDSDIRQVTRPRILC